MNETTTHQSVQTAGAPAAIGPYSQAVVAGGMVFCSGQIPLDPATGQMVAGDVSAQTRRVLDNLDAVLAAAGSSFAHVVKTSIFLADLNDFVAVNAVHRPGTLPIGAVVLGQAHRGSGFSPTGPVGRAAASA